MDLAFWVPPNYEKNIIRKYWSGIIKDNKNINLWILKNTTENFNAILYVNNNKGGGQQLLLDVHCTLITEGIMGLSQKGTQDPLPQGFHNLKMSGMNPLENTQKKV